MLLYFILKNTVSPFTCVDQGGIEIRVPATAYNLAAELELIQLKDTF